MHLEVDTGMSRQGVRLVEFVALLDGFRRCPRCGWTALMTHFHSPEMLDSPRTRSSLRNL